jgi:hypothetical protein
MDQQSIILFLSMKGLYARDIHDELAAVLSSNAIGDSTVAKYPVFPAIHKRR